MGRRPNQLIGEYFIRGAKLEDSSNRYEHTCRACGELFPKGRVDSLIPHLTKKCIALTLPERTRIVLLIHDLTDETSSKASDGSKSEQRGNVNLPYSLSRPANFNGLNVLAEASRRVGATDQTEGKFGNVVSHAESQQLPVDPALEVEQDGYASGFLNTSEESFGTQSGEAPTSALQFNQSIDQSGSKPSEAASIDLLEERHASPMSSHLTSLAASANETLANELTPIQSDTNADTNIFDNLAAFSNLSNTSNGTQQEISTAWSNFNGTQMIEQPLSNNETQDLGPHPINQPASSSQRPLAINPNTRPTVFFNESGNSRQARKPKSRANFTPERRKEVNATRKMGSCNRCRFLKKPCSATDVPCRLCASIVHARLWTLPCDRTKLRQFFTLFWAGLHAKLASQDIDRVKDQVQFENFAGSLEVSSSNDHLTPMLLSALAAQRNTQTASGPDEVMSDGLAASSESALYLIQDGVDEFSFKLGQYIREAATSVHVREQSQFMRSTLELASELNQAKGYLLLTNVLELWTAMYMLTDLQFSWEFTLNPTLSLNRLNGGLADTPVSMHVFADTHYVINEANNTYSYSLLCTQLRAAVEKRLEGLANVIVKNLENRIYQKNTSDNLEDFIASLILLNVVERLSWLTLTWNGEDQSSGWPLPKRPATYAEEGDLFADRLNMIVSMRKLATKKDDETGKLAMLPSMRNKETGKLELLPEAQANGPIDKWLNEIKVNGAFGDRLSVAQFNANDPRSLDGKYFATMLLPMLGSI